MDCLILFHVLDQGKLRLCNYQSERLTVPSNIDTAIDEIY
jgi:hypothetical protein